MSTSPFASAAQLLTERGWSQYEPEDGRLTLGAALSLAMFGKEIRDMTELPAKQQERLYEALGSVARVVGIETGDLADWEDESWRSFDSVLTALRDAGAVAEQDMAPGLEL